MKKVSFVVNQSYGQNRIFDPSDLTRQKYYMLKKEFFKHGYDLSTNDINDPQDSDIILYFDMPIQLPKDKDREKSYLLAIESSIIKPENFNTQKHSYFHKIFTWNDDLVDDQKFIKINYAFQFPEKIEKRIQRDKLCCLIVSNKRSNFPNELYSERERLVQWFEKNHTDLFDLYGYGWDSLSCHSSRVVRKLNTIPGINSILRKLLVKRYKVYKGTIEDKITTMKNYRFTIAYENVKDENGYITEKLFDAFIAGCVPVYWGAKNITDYVPKECFIDRRDFQSNEALFSYMYNMSNQIYEEYLNHIETYLNSQQAKQFTIDTFCQRIVSHCIQGDVK